MVTELMYEALALMFIGMGVVFAFLFILVLLVQLMSRLLTVKTAPTAPLPSTPITSPPITSATQDMAQTVVPAPVVAAISAAVQQYRQEHQLTEPI